MMRVHSAFLTMWIGTIPLAWLSLLALWGQATADVLKTSGEPDLIALLKAHNERRAAEKLPPLKHNDKLAAAAIRHARDMALHKKMSHDGSDGSTPKERIEEADYHGRSVAENVASGYKSIQTVVEGWMNSPSHRVNVLGDFDEIGAAWAASSDGVRYWSVEFGLSWPQLDPDTATTDLLAALNRARDEAEKLPLKSQPKLQVIAQRHVQENAERDRFATKDEGKALFDQIATSGYRFRQVAMSDMVGQATPDDVVKAWLDDHSQRDNILGDFVDIGLGYARSATGKPYWTAILTRPLGSK